MGRCASPSLFHRWGHLATVRVRRLAGAIRGAAIARPFTFTLPAVDLGLAVGLWPARSGAVGKGQLWQDGPAVKKGREDSRV